MNFRIYFCADGILRASFSKEKPMIPLKFLQENGSQKDNDLRFWVKWWESYVVFEEGLTVGKFLQCLEPWSEFWQDITGKDVGAYAKEARTPLSVEDTSEGLDWVSLSYNTEVCPNVDYHEDSEAKADESFEDWLNAPMKKRLTGMWDIHSSYKLSGFTKGENEQYCIDYSPMNRLANLPFVLSQKHVLHISQFKLKRYFKNTNDAIFKDDAFGICSLHEGKTQYLVGEREHRMREVVEGFFWWLPGNPTKRKNFIDRVLSQKDEIVDILENTPKKEDNVVNIFKEDVSKQEIDEVENETTETKLKVKVSDGAFSGIIAAHDADEE